MTIQELLNYLERLDDSANYPTFGAFLSDLNRQIEIPIIYQVDGGELKSESYTLSYLMSVPVVASEQFQESVENMGVDLPLDLFFSLSENENLNIINEAEDFETYINALSQFLTDLETEQEYQSTDSVITYSSPPINLNVEEGERRITPDELRKEVQGWVQKDVDETPYSVDNPKVGSPNQILAGPQQGVDEVTGQTRFSSYKYYSGPNLAINELDQYINPTDGTVKRDGNGDPIKPVFMRGAASELFRGLSQEAIFEIQQELSGLGLDLGSYNFVPGVIDFTAQGNEIDFVAQLMTQANDANAMFPQMNLINTNGVTFLEQLRPYLEYKKGVDENVNSYLEDLQGKFAGEILPPSDSEVKAAVDSLFAEKGLFATSNDYAKYATIFGDLQKQAAQRELEIEDNKISLNDLIGLTKTNKDFPGGYTYAGFGIATPTAEQAREQLGKPLLQNIDVMSELEKIIENLEAGRIDASQEIVSRAAAAQQFKSNFMQFEENF